MSNPKSLIREKSIRAKLFIVCPSYAGSEYFCLSQNGIGSFSIYNVPKQFYDDTLPVSILKYEHGGVIENVLTLVNVFNAQHRSWFVPYLINCNGVAFRI